MYNPKYTILESLSKTSYIKCKVLSGTILIIEKYNKIIYTKYLKRNKNISLRGNGYKLTAIEV